MTGRDTHPLQLLVRKLETHHPLQDADRAAILGLPHKLRAVEPQTYLLREGDRPERCAVIVSGYAFRHKLTGDGARQILSIHISGEAVDFQNLFLEQSDHNAQMLTRGEIADIPIGALEELANANAGVGRAMFVSTLVEASVFREWTLNVGRRDGRTRIAHLLCEFAVRLSAQGLDGHHGYELPMTQEQLADATGLTSVHVNRTLKPLQADRLIDRDRRAIRFPDWKAMRDVGDFTTRYLRIQNA
ncbi:Crp/Fnr family transcriptional regulator [Sphingomonas sp.]|jgi:CRP-like cAMP-binding protein|uniref:Crp/Fnr family transcriptional regulator n=1 Tax=Sphingomonas sp. TaxID=28214 RepID=UPI002DE82477|nr:Crp/Fnr family transcriptional regulator [Sphingomonas sp.]